MCRRIAGEMQSSKGQDQDNCDDPKCLDPTWGARRRFAVWLHMGGWLAHVLQTLPDSERRAEVGAVTA
jgi:hypothetical protein